ncbi:hypothetical protein [Streptomyces sudanensis]|uniref:hypothetical protein n=1 Tax=Streptomyces sudanensis TaxID=436397 RepID=UPI0020CD6D42|nr:hypothetical protein [Streptomyces sudanensis]MCP9957285.1 hypothetical protein [Streptomyces sudanensis]MCQ0002156.1 hypothetical protein [Streptomyces sudanensis]
MTDDNLKSKPNTSSSRTAWVFLVAAGALAVLGYTATEALNASMKPESAETGAVSPAASSNAAIPPTPDCGGSGADFTACSADRMACEEQAAHLGAHPQPAPGRSRLNAELCADIAGR